MSIRSFILFQKKELNLLHRNIVRHHSNRNQHSEVYETLSIPFRSLVVKYDGTSFVSSSDNSENGKLLLHKIHPRDMHLLDHQADKFMSSPATLLVRDTHSIVHLLRFSGVIGSNCIHLFRSSSTSSKIVAKNIQNAVLKVKCSNNYDFPLIALEKALVESTEYLEGKLQRLTLLVHEVTTPLKSNEGLSSLHFQRILPIHQSLDEIETDIRELNEMFKEALSVDFNQLDFLIPRCDTETTRTVEERRNIIVQILQTHGRYARAMGGRVTELKNALEATRNMWELQLDVDRNRVVRLNLQATILGMSVALGALPASVFGMNLPSGLEESSVGVGFSIASVSILAMVYGTFSHFTYQSKGSINEKSLQDLKSLKYVLANMDELDDVLRDDLKNSETGRDRKMLSNVLKKANIRNIDDSIIDLVFNVFDKDRDGSLESTEWLDKDEMLKKKLEKKKLN